jgi:nitrogen regulatory protein PII
MNHHTRNRLHNVYNTLFLLHICFSRNIQTKFCDKYILQVVVADNKVNDIIEIVRANSKIGNIFISPIMRSVDIESGAEIEKTI